MIRDAQCFHARQVMAAGQGQIVAETMRPGFADEAVLALEFAAFGVADGSEQGQGKCGAIGDRADPLRGSGCS